MPSVCELKVELKAKGIKGITGLNKAGLQALLNKGGDNNKKGDELYNKAEKFLNKMDKAFTPAPTKGESPKVAEKKITKKARVVKPLMITYKEETKTQAKPPPKLRKLTEDERVDMLNTKGEATKCQKLMKKAGLENLAELKKYLIANHPDKMKDYDPTSKAAMLYRELSSCSTTFKNLKGYLAEGLIKGFKGL